MMGRQTADQARLFYEFHLDDRVPPNHLLRRIDVFATAALADLHQKLADHYSRMGRPSVDPELLIRMLLVGYCYGIRSERRLCEEVADRLTFRWFCRLDLDDRVPDHSTFSKNRHGRFRDSDVLRHIFERVVLACITAGLVGGDAQLAGRGEGHRPARPGHRQVGARGWQLQPCRLPLRCGRGCIHLPG